MREFIGSVSDGHSVCVGLPSFIAERIMSVASSGIPMRLIKKRLIDSLTRDHRDSRGSWYEFCRRSGAVGGACRCGMRI